MGAYVGAVAVGTFTVRARGRRLPDRVSGAEVALIAGATFQLSRIVAKQPIASPLRAPFTTFDGVSGPSELREQVRGEGLRHALGELITCPFCLAHWFATAFGLAFVLAPDLTRLVTALLSAEAIADFLQYAYSAAQSSVD